MLILLSSCAAPNSWKFESIDTQETLFSAARLLYSNGESPIRFEILRNIESEIYAFLSLTKYHFTPAREVKIEFSSNEERWEETVPLLEGNMRLRFPTEMTEKIIARLQEGKQVVMMLDGFEQCLDPAGFASQYEKMGHIFQNPFKGLFDP
ncbi:MAG TPA: hypothetical protein VLE95_08360 [Chlamydiales bacterium]|nr:hypothetical protein [Chlamydiales bacterium]